MNTYIPISLKNSRAYHHWNLGFVYSYEGSLEYFNCIVKFVYKHRKSNKHVELILVEAPLVLESTDISGIAGRTRIVELTVELKGIIIFEADLF